MKHDFGPTPLYCDIAHYENGKPVPCCQKCVVCGEWVKWDETDQECRGKEMIDKAVYTIKIPNCVDVLKAATMLFEAQVPGIHAEDCVIASDVDGTTVHLTYLLTPDVIDAMCKAGHMCPVCLGSAVKVIERCCTECGNVWSAE